MISVDDATSIWPFFSAYSFTILYLQLDSLLVMLLSYQVYPGAWTAVLVSLDNVGIWNLRTENLDTWYLGQEVYLRVVNPEITNRTELPMPDNVLYCGLLQDHQK